MPEFDGEPADSPRSTPPASSRDPKQVLDALSNLRCRLVLEFLDEEQQVTTVDHLAVVVAARLAEKVVDSPPRVEAVRVSLEHRHLPELESSGLVSFHLESGIVEREFDGPAATAVRDETSEAR